MTRNKHTSHRIDPSQWVTYQNEHTADIDQDAAILLVCNTMGHTLTTAPNEMTPTVAILVDMVGRRASNMVA